MIFKNFVATATALCLFLSPLELPWVATLHAQTDSTPLLSQADLEQLVAPIALYPDPLLALILPASTVPTDIVLANRFVTNGGDPNAIDQQPWDDNVKGLARYPDVLAMMDENLDWTNQLGAAVLAQQGDVMNAIQAMRAKAQTLGNLQTTAQQQVLTQDQAIQILPADPQVIYVPVYNPQVVYVQPAPAVPFITFGLGLAMGAWIGGNCDWHRHSIYYGGWYRPGYGWNRNVTINNHYYWRPNPAKPRPRPPYQPGRPGGQLPGWRPPPNNRPPGGPNRPGYPNRPGNPGRPSNPGSGPNRPGNPGGGNPGTPTRPGRPNADRPSIQPVKPQPGQRPSQPGNTRPNKPSNPTIQPYPNRGGNNPSAQPMPSLNPRDFNRQRPDSKRNSSHPAATPAQRPAPTQRPAQPPRTAPAQRQPQAQRPAPSAQPAAQRGGSGGGGQRPQRP